jgi:hypothetical protein
MWHTMDWANLVILVFLWTGGISVALWTVSRLFPSIRRDGDD